MNFRFSHRMVRAVLALLLVSACLPWLGAAEPASTVGAAKAPSTVVNMAPSFVGGTSQGRSITLASLKGRPVVLILASDSKNSAFRKQLKALHGSYEKLATQGVLFFAGFTSTSGAGNILSNIPFILLDNPAGTASAYGVSGGFAIAVIGVDGNLDCLSSRPLPGERVLDLVNNNASVQQRMRR